MIKDAYSIFPSSALAFNLMVPRKLKNFPGAPRRFLLVLYCPDGNMWVLPGRKEESKCSMFLDSEMEIIKKKGEL